MTSANVIRALNLPPQAMVHQRVPKKLLLENGAPTAADKREINEGIEDLVWLAALKPQTIGVPEFRDGVREYLEIAVLSLSLRSEAKSTRLLELIHRAIPYPVFLITEQELRVNVSLAHKRSAQNEAGRVVLEGNLGNWMLDPERASSTSLVELSVSAQPRSNLWFLYQGWFACLEAYEAAAITGRLTFQSDIPAQERRREALAAYLKLQKEISNLRGQAEKEKQINRRVELNLAVRRLEEELKKVTDAL